VCAAQESGEEARAAALETLCGAYWYPLYAYVRRRGYPASESEDLTQEFFRRLLEKDYLKAADQEKGKFRTFLLVAMQRFLANEWHRAHAAKRGGGCTFVPIDADRAEAMYHHEPADQTTPESLYERRWGLLVLERALAAVRQDMEQCGKAALFEALKDALTGSPTGRTYEQIGAEFGLSEGAVKATMHRLRARFRAHIREVIAETVRNTEDVDEEIRHLFSVFSG
jgi:RNA polymerase sigma-70 factor (ECF subfamily)